MALAFGTKRLSLTALSMRDITKFSTGCVEPGGIFVSLVNAIMKEVHCLQRSMLRSGTSSRVLFSAKDVSLVLM